MRTILFVILLFCVSAFAKAQQFSYKPISPFFGGDTFNYQQIITSVNVQNSLTAPVKKQEGISDLDQFSQELNRNLLNAIESQLSQAQLSALNITEEGIFTFGSLNVEVFETFEGLVINILDTNNGEETQIVVPNSN